MQLSTGNQGFPLPAVIHPATSTCIQIQVPDDPAYMQAVIGVLYDLTLWLSWQRDSARTGIQASQVMKTVWNNIDFSGNCDNMYAIRQNPSNPCLIDASVDGGVTWTTVVDMSLCIDGYFPPNNPADRGQPGAQPGGSTPAPGQCFDLDITIPADQKFLIPYPVTDGWTVEISNPHGAWDEGGIAPYWFCYDGHHFTLGACLTPGLPAGGDPVPTVNHMALVMLYPAGGSSPGIQLLDSVVNVVPSGTGTGLYLLQANDSNLTDNSGSVNCHLHVCAPLAVCASYDFTTGMSGWELSNTSNHITGTYNNEGGLYQSGIGWTSSTTPGTDAGNANAGQIDEIVIQITGISCHVHNMHVHGVKHSGASALNVYGFIVYAETGIAGGSSGTVAAGSGAFTLDNALDYSKTLISIYLLVAAAVYNPPITNGLITITGVTFD